MCSSLVVFFFFFSSRRRHTRWTGDWSSDVCSSDLVPNSEVPLQNLEHAMRVLERQVLFGRPGLERAHQVVERRADALRDQVLRGRPWRDAAKLACCDRADLTRGWGLGSALVLPGGVVVATLEPIVRPERG